MNTLYPIFLKTEMLHILLIGGGKAAAEKINFIYKNSPNAIITLVAKEISEEVILTANTHKSLSLIEKAFAPNDLEGKQLVIAATADKIANEEIYRASKQRNMLINVADTPELCDFFLGSIVTKGDLKIAISTNGKSPTMSKRLREFFEDILPDELQTLIDNLHQYRSTLKTTFEQKVKALNEVTNTFLKK